MNALQISVPWTEGHSIRLKELSFGGGGRRMRIIAKKQLRNNCQSVTDLRDSSARAPLGGIFVKFDIRDLYENFREI